MREVLDRLQEATTALDNFLNDLYYTQHTADRLRAIELCWKAKRHVWYASMDVLNAASGPQPTGLGK